MTKFTRSCNDDKRLQTIDRITSIPYRRSVRKVTKTQFLGKYERLFSKINQNTIQSGHIFQFIQTGY